RCRWPKLASLGSRARDETLKRNPEVAMALIDAIDRGRRPLRLVEQHRAKPATMQHICVLSASKARVGLPPSPMAAKRVARRTSAGLPSRSSRSRRKLVGPAGLEPATTPL